MYCIVGSQQCGGTAKHGILGRQRKWTLGGRMAQAVKKRFCAADGDHSG